MDDQEQGRPRRTAWKWVSLGLLVLTVPVLVVLAGYWAIASLGGIGGGSDPTSGPAGASFGILLLGFVAGVGAWVTGCVVQRPRPARGRLAFLLATAAVAVGLVGGAAAWTPVAWQASRQDALVADLTRLDQMLPEGYRLVESRDRTDSAGFVEPRREWSVPKGARPCEQLGPVLTRWAGTEPETSPENRYGVCTFETTRYGWDVTVRVDADRGRVELKTAA